MTSRKSKNVNFSVLPFPPPPSTRKPSISRPYNPAYIPKPPIPPQSSKIQSPSFFRMVLEGFAFGTGGSVAREAIHNMPIFAPTSDTEKSKIANVPSECSYWQTMYEECLEKEESMCVDLFDKVEKVCYNTQPSTYNNTNINL